MRIHSNTAWDIAWKYNHYLASETRDLAAWIDEAINKEREACAAIAEQHRVGGEKIAAAIRQRQHE